MTTELQAGWPRINPVPRLGCPIPPKAVICEETTRRCVDRLGKRLRAIVLTGSLARDEGTFVEEGGRVLLLGDAEFLLIFHEGSRLLPSVSLDPLRRKIEKGLLQRNMLCQISLNRVRPSYLRKLRPHIFAYELRACGQVVWGDPEILSLIPRFSASDVSLEDAWRLLCNRMIELLEVVDQLTDRSATPSRSVHYRTVKLYLDMATSYLLFARAYEPTYRRRAEKLWALAASTSPDDEVPFPLRGFAQRVIACTEVKLLGLDQHSLAVVPEEGRPGIVFWEEAVTYAEQLWRWELVRLTGLREHLSNRVLWEGWVCLEPFCNKLRGWLSLLRRRGLHRSWRDWPRWARRAWGASPRYWIYGAASELFFRLPWLVVPDGQRQEPELDWEELRRSLPVTWEATPCNGKPVWRQLGSEIVWNYHEFLEKTRA